MVTLLKLADYKYYVETYRGTMGEDDFNKCILAASAYLNKITFGRIETHINDLSQDIKHLACLCADEVKALSDSKVDGKIVSSISNDGYSVSFADAGQASRQDEAYVKIYYLARLYLPDEYLFMGVY